MYSAVLFPGRMPGNVSAVFADIVRHFHRIENDADIEEAEKDDSDDIQQVVQRHPLSQLRRKALHERVRENRAERRRESTRSKPQR